MPDVSAPGTDGIIDAMRAVTLLLCVGLAGCAATEPGSDAVFTSAPAPQASAPQVQMPQPSTPQAATPQTPEPQTPEPQAPMMQPAAVAPAPAPQPSPPPTPTPAAAPAPVAAAARGTTAPRPPEPAPVTAEPMTHERASALCWMRYEDGRKKLTLDQRAELVDKCVKATMSGEKPK